MSGLAATQEKALQTSGADMSRELAVVFGSLHKISIDIEHKLLRLCGSISANDSCGIFSCIVILDHLKLVLAKRRECSFPVYCKKRSRRTDVDHSHFENSSRGVRFYRNRHRSLVPTAGQYSSLNLGYVWY